jgi:hypothetical protein
LRRAVKHQHHLVLVLVINARYSALNAQILIN